MSKKTSEPRAAIYSTLVKFRSDSKIVDAIACRITWVGIVEQASEQATYAFDKDAIKEVIEISGDEQLLDEFNNGKISFHRYPKIRKANSSRSRIINIYLGCQKLRDKMLEHMRTGRKSLTKEVVHSYVRTDYTREELDYDRTLCRKAKKVSCYML